MEALATLVIGVADADRRGRLPLRRHLRWAARSAPGWRCATPTGSCRSPWSAPPPGSAPRRAGTNVRPWSANTAPRPSPKRRWGRWFTGSRRQDGGPGHDRRPAGGRRRGLRRVLRGHLGLRHPRRTPEHHHPDPGRRRPRRPRRSPRPWPANWPTASRARRCTNSPGPPTWPRSNGPDAVLAAMRAHLPQADGQAVRRAVLGDDHVDRAVAEHHGVHRRLPGPDHPLRLGRDLDPPRPRPQDPQLHHAHRPASRAGTSKSSPCT